MAGTQLRLSVLVDSKGRASLKQIEKDLDKAGIEVKKLGKEGKKSTGLLAKGAKNVTRSLGPMVAGLVGAAAAFKTLGDSARASIDFERQMAEVSTLVDTRIVNMDELADGARRIGVEFGQSFDVVTKSLYDSISAGIPAAEAIGFMEKASQLAVAGVTDLSTAVDQLTSVFNAYSENDFTKINDVIFASVQKGKTTVEELSNVVGRVAPIAEKAGVSLEEMYAGIATGTLGGLSTAESARGLRATLAALIKPAEEAKKKFAELNIDISSSRIKSDGLTAVLKDLWTATDGNVERFAELIPTVEALPVALTLASDGAAKYEEVLNAVQNSSGAAEEATAKMSETLDFKIKQLTSAWQDFKVELGDNMKPVVDAMVTALKELAIAAKGAFNLIEKLAFSSVDVENQFGIDPGGKSVKAIEDELRRLDELERKNKSIIAQGFLRKKSTRETAQAFLDSLDARRKGLALELEQAKVGEKADKDAAERLKENQRKAKELGKVVTETGEIIATEASGDILNIFADASKSDKVKALGTALKDSVKGTEEEFNAALNAVDERIKMSADRLADARARAEAGTATEADATVVDEELKNQAKLTELHKQGVDARGKYEESEKKRLSKEDEKLAKERARKDLEETKRSLQESAIFHEQFVKQIVANSSEAVGDEVKSAIDTLKEGYKSAEKDVADTFDALGEHADKTGESISEGLSAGVVGFQDDVKKALSTFDKAMAEGLATYDKNLMVAHELVNAIKVDIALVNKEIKEGGKDATKAQITEIDALEARLRKLLETIAKLEKDKTDLVKDGAEAREEVEKQTTDATNDYSKNVTAATVEENKRTFIGGWKDATQGALRELTNMGKHAANIFNLAQQGLGEMVSNPIKVLLGRNKEAVQGLKGNVRELEEEYSELEEKIADPTATDEQIRNWRESQKEITEQIGTIKDEIHDLSSPMKAVKDAWSKVWDSMVDYALKKLGEFLASAILSKFLSVFSDFGKGFNVGFDSLISAVGSGLGKVKDLVTTGITAVGAAASKGLSAVGSALGLTGAGAGVASAGTAATGIGITATGTAAAGATATGGATIAAGSGAAGAGSIASLAATVAPYAVAAIAAYGVFKLGQALFGDHKSGQQKLLESGQDRFKEQTGMELGNKAREHFRSFDFKGGVEEFFDMFTEEWRGVFGGDARQQFIDVMTPQIAETFGVGSDMAGVILNELELWAHDMGVSAQDFARITGDASTSVDQKFKQLAAASGNLDESFGMLAEDGTVVSESFYDTADSMGSLIAQGIHPVATNLGILGAGISSTATGLSKLQDITGELGDEFRNFEMPEFNDDGDDSKLHTGKRGGLPKFHSGRIGANEQAAIIQKREWVLQPEQLASMLRQANKQDNSGSVIVKIENSTFNGTAEENAAAIEQVLYNRIIRKESALNLLGIS